MRERIALYFPKDHLIMKIPKNDRVKAIKEVINKRYERKEPDKVNCKKSNRINFEKLLA